ncbi:MAG: D-alanine--D-alanine ligase [Phycisphaerales bacterium]|nr:D-alanine--D-alanine ligase [Phycisphaerales bacterium]
MSDALHVLVLMGGPDAERAVSIQSGLAITKALETNPAFKVHSKIIDLVDIETLRQMPGDVIFPALHGPWGEGGGLQELLQELGRPYVGSEPTAARMAMEKMVSKEAALAGGFWTPAAVRVGPEQTCPLDPPLVIKPVNEGSSIDVMICPDKPALDSALSKVQGQSGDYMCEAYIEGREITVGIVNDRVLPFIEIIPATKTYDYEAKYNRNDTNYVINPDLTPEVQTRCRLCAIDVFERLGCRDIARVDFMVDDRGTWFLEINTMPGFTDHSLVPKAAAAAGLTMSELCIELVEAAYSRSHLQPSHDCTGTSVK